MLYYGCLYEKRLRVYHNRNNHPGGYRLSKHKEGTDDEELFEKNRNETYLDDYHR